MTRAREVADQGYIESPILVAKYDLQGLTHLDLKLDNQTDYEFLMEGLSDADERYWNMYLLIAAGAVVSGSFLAAGVGYGGIATNTGWYAAGDIGSGGLIAYSRNPAGFYIHGHLHFERSATEHIHGEFASSSFNSSIGHAVYRSTLDMYSCAEEVYGIRLAQLAAGSLANGGTLKLWKKPKTPVIALPAFADQ